MDKIIKHIDEEGMNSFLRISLWTLFLLPFIIGDITKAQVNSDSPNTTVSYRINNPEQDKTTFSRITPDKEESKKVISSQIADSTSDQASMASIYSEKSKYDQTDAVLSSNLTILFIDLLLNPVKMDESEKITITVQNAGSSSVSNRKIEYYLSIDNVISASDFYIGQDYVSLSSGEQGTESITFTPNNISGLTAGTYFVGIIIPDEYEYWYRNGTLLISSAGIANLVVLTFELSNNPLKMNESETITTILKNSGTASASSREIQYYLSYDNVIATSDYYIGRDYVSLSAGEQGTESISFTPQEISGLTPGVYYVGIIIPDEYEYWYRIGTLTINSAGIANLVVPFIELSANPVNMDENETITTSIKNEGTGSVSNRQIKYYLSLDNIITTSDYYIGDDNISLSANEQGTETITFTPNSINGLTAGIYYVGVIIPEEYEYWYRNGTLQINAVGIANIVLSTMELSANPLNMDETETITTTLKNEGTASISNREIQYYLSVDNIISIIDYYIGDDQVSLSPGEQGTESITFAPKDIGGLAAGTYYVGVIIPDEYEYWCRNGTLIITDIGYPEIEVSPTSLTITESNNNSRSNNLWEDYTGPIAQNSSNSDEHGLGCKIPKEIVEYWKTHVPKVKLDLQSLKSSIDWSNYDSPVKDQKTCGSCWAFAATALIENLGIQTDLSEQVLVSCIYSNSCQDGGYFNDAFNYFKNIGVPDESCYPYTNSDGNCSEKCANPTFLEKVTEVYPLWGDASVDLLRAELNNGPIVVSMRVPEPWPYTHGIYNYNGGPIAETRGHAVLVVGYNDDQQCFKAKNSWGPEWGEGGYFRIAYDDVTDDVRFGYYATKVWGVYTEGESENSFLIKNIGGKDLNISSINDNANWLSTSGYSGTSFTISKSTSVTVNIDINWTLITLPQHTGTITINSNDPDEPSVQVEVTAIKNITDNPPTVQITAPSNNQSFSSDEITIQGTADDESPGTITKVEVKLNNGSWKSADGTKNWNSFVNLQPGNNTIYARSKDNGDQYSELASVLVRYEPIEEVYLTITGPSEVSNNQEFELAVKINEVKNLKVISFDFIYPTQFIDYLNHTVGTFVPSSQATVLPDDKNGRVSTSVFTLSGSGSGTGVIITLRFKVLNNPAAGTNFRFCYENIQANDASGNLIPIIPECRDIPLVNGLTVWPGDANNDGVVNIIDINPIITNFNTKGPTRNPSGIQWIEQICEPWNPAHRTYVDCNGNGTIEITDVNGVVVNFNKTHTLTQDLAVNTAAGNDPPLSVYFNPGAKAGEEFWVYVNIGSTDLPINTMNIISYELLYTGTNFIDYITYEPGSFLSGVTSYVIPDAKGGKISTSSFNLSQGYSGYGEAFKYKFKVADTVNYPHSIYFYWGLVSANRMDGSIQPLDTLSFIESIVPVELTSFNASFLLNEVILAWSTATETNNSGFEIERQFGGGEWNKIGFVSGSGSTTEEHRYSYKDKLPESGLYNYRLKQIDFNGSYHFSHTINLDVDMTPDKYTLSQNYPNPFNPTTVIKYDIPEDSYVSLIVYNILGDRVTTLVNERKIAGSYEIKFSASDLANGVYFYELRANTFRDIKKLILIK